MAILSNIKATCQSERTHPEFLLDYAVFIVRVQGQLI